MWREGEKLQQNVPGQEKRAEKGTLTFLMLQSETISTLAGKRHHTHYSDRGKHALSPEPFQILLRPTQQSCTSRFLTEGNPDVIHITPWNSAAAAAAVPLPSLLLSTQQMKKCLKSRGLCCTMRICLAVNCSTRTWEDAEPAEGAEKGAPKTSLHYDSF